MTKRLLPLATIADLSHFRDVALHRLHYVVLRHAITATHTAGRVWLFDRSTQRRILDALAATDLHPNSAPGRLRRATEMIPAA